MHHRKFSNYWTSTETYDALKTYMDMDFDGPRRRKHLFQTGGLDWAHTEVASILTYNNENTLSYLQALFIY